MQIRCPICNKNTTLKENPWRPFCSQRCKLIDLGKWAGEEYKIFSKDEEEFYSSLEKDTIIPPPNNTSPS